MYETVIRRVLWYAGQTWMMSGMVEMVIGDFEENVLGRMYGPVLENAQWRIVCNKAICGLCEDVDVVTYSTEKAGMGWTYLQSGWI
jgi:hypothetical protein